LQRSFPDWLWKKPREEYIMCVAHGSEADGLDEVCGGVELALQLLDRPAPAGGHTHVCKITQWYKYRQRRTSCDKTLTHLEGGRDGTRGGGGGVDRGV
jgi:hypothetical protein